MAKAAMGAPVKTVIISLHATTGKFVEAFTRPVNRPNVSLQVLLVDTNGSGLAGIVTRVF